MFTPPSILIVDPDVIWQEIFVNRLKALGVEAESFNTPPPAIKRASDKRFNLILVELDLPNSHWRETIRTLSFDRHPQAAPVAAFTRISERAALEECLANGFAAYYLKSEHSIPRLIDSLAARFI